MEATAWIALVALGFTGSQAWIAQRKLRFDLFTKRYEAWEAINDAINQKAELSPAINPQVFRKLDLSPAHAYKGDQEEILIRIFRLQRQMQFLFPVDVSNNIDKILGEISLKDGAVLYLAELEASEDGKDETKIKATKKTIDLRNNNIVKIQYELAGRVHSYVHLYGINDILGGVIRQIYRNLRRSKPNDG